MPVIFYLPNYEDVMAWPTLRHPTAHAQALEKAPEVTDSETANLRSAPSR
jgi:hypothetical protein